MTYPDVPAASASARKTQNGRLAPSPATTPVTEHSDGTDLGGDYPNLAELLGRAPGFSLDGEFEYGLQRIIEALEATGSV